jgi:hypothetical protein
MLASLQGHVVRGRSTRAIIATSSCGTGRPPAPVDRDVALAELPPLRGRAGWPTARSRPLGRPALRDARGPERDRVELEPQPGGLVALRGGRSGRAAPPRLLGPFEPLLLGWRSREPVLARTRAS